MFLLMRRHSRGRKYPGTAAHSCAGGPAPSPPPLLRQQRGIGIPGCGDGETVRGVWLIALASPDVEFADVCCDAAC